MESIDWHKYNKAPNNPYMSSICNTLPKYLIDKFSQLEPEDFDKTYKVLKDRTNFSMQIASDTQKIIKEFIHACCDIIELNEIKKIWKEFTNKDNVDRRELFAQINFLIQAKKNNIASQNDIVQLERTKEHMNEELNNLRKEIAILKNQNDNLRAEKERSKTEWDKLNGQHELMKEMYRDLLNRLN